ncbi:MAG: substrate-binding domain-containing protein, partial [Firmicutes bacterium]|nr:substrate-binding domain-containing protein [Bacillota bacterium]
MKKKWIALGMTVVLAMTALVGCGGGEEGADADGGFNTAKQVAVMSREDGSGTRGAFVELFGVEQKNAEGVKVDMTTLDASITNNTAAMMTGVAGNEYAIGYISLGSLDDSVKALKIDGADASVENIKNGSYGVARPFNVAFKEPMSDVAKDFLDFIASADGQAVIEANGYIAINDGAAAYSGAAAEGKIVVAGSSSVTPVMEKLKEAYLALNPNVTIDIQQSDSSTGMTSAMDGTCDIGMASRALKDSELAGGLVGTTIAMD